MKSKIKTNVKMKAKRNQKIAAFLKPFGVIVGLICLVQLTKTVNRKQNRWFLVNQMSDL